MDTVLKWIEMLWKPYGRRSLIVIALALAGWYLYDYYQCDTLSDILSPNLRRVFCPLGCSVVLALAFMKFPRTQWGRFQTYVKGAAASALRTPRVIRATDGNQECMMIRLDKRVGAVSLWVRLSKVGKGVRQSTHRFFFSYSGGYHFNGKCAINNFALIWCHLQTTDEGIWVFEVTNRQGEPYHIEEKDNLSEGWHHFVCAWDVRTMCEARALRLYIDSERVRTSQSKDEEQIRDSYPDVRGVVPLLIGSWTNLNVRHYAEEEIGWVAYFPRLLDDEHIKKLHDIGAPTE